MRIIGGKYKGKSIVIPKGLPKRPTTDYAKESLFNILNNSIDFEEIKLLNFLPELEILAMNLPQGVVNKLLVELNFNCIQFIKKTNKKLELQHKVIRSDVFRFIKYNKEKYNFIFADPPYKLEKNKKYTRTYFF